MNLCFQFEFKHIREVVLIYPVCIMRFRRKRRSFLNQTLKKNPNRSMRFRKKKCRLFPSARTHIPPVSSVANSDRSSPGSFFFMVHQDRSPGCHPAHVQHIPRKDLRQDRTTMFFLLRNNRTTPRWIFLVTYNWMDGWLFSLASSVYMIRPH